LNINKDGMLHIKIHWFIIPTLDFLKYAINLLVESLKILNKTLQEEGIYVWYIFCIKQSQ
jgi:hypothetical protein